MRRTRHVVLPVKSWQYMGLMIVSLACLTLGLVSRDREGRSGSLAGPELNHTAPHGVDACPNVDPFIRLAPYDKPALEKVSIDATSDDIENSESMSRDRSYGYNFRAEPVSMLPNRKLNDNVGRQRLESRSWHGKSADDVIRSRQNHIDRLVKSRSIDDSRRVVGRMNDRSEQRRSFEGREMNPVERQERRTRRLERTRNVERRQHDRVNRGNVETVGERSERRRFSERREINPVERQERRTRRLEGTRNVERRQHDRVNRGNVETVGERSERRRFSEGREMSPVERQERGTNSLERTRDVEQRQRRRVNRSNVESVGKRSERRRFSEGREMSPVERQERGTNSLERTRDVEQRQRRRVNRSNVESVGKRSEQPRFSERRGMSPIERQERRAISLEISRDVKRRQHDRVNRGNVRRVVERSERWRLSEGREISPVESQERRTNNLERSHDVERRQHRRVIRENVQTVQQRSGQRKFSDDRRVNPDARKQIRNDFGASSKLNYDTRVEVNTIGVRSQERRSIEGRRTNAFERQPRRVDISATSRNFERSQSRYVRRPQVERLSEGRSVERKIGETSWMSSLRRDVSLHGISGNRYNERRDRLASRDNAHERRERFVERDNHRERRTSDRNYRTSGTINRDDVPRTEIRDVRHRINSIEISKLEGHTVMANTEISDYLRQAMVLGICAVYGASLFKDKRGFYGFRNILNHVSRLGGW